MKVKYLKVEGSENLYRDSETGAILNTSNSAYANHKKSKELVARKMEEERRRETRLNNLEQDVKTLKDGINKILELLNNGA